MRTKKIEFSYSVAFAQKGDEHTIKRTVNFCFTMYFLGQNMLKQKKTHFVSIVFIVLWIYNFGKLVVVKADTLFRLFIVIFQSRKYANHHFHFAYNVDNFASLVSKYAKKKTRNRNRC